MGRLRAMIVKEIWALLRDRKSYLVLFVPPLLQLCVFTFASTLDVRNIDVGVLNLSNGAHSTELVSQIAGSPNFRRIVPVRSTGEMRAIVDRQEVIAVLVIDQDFDRTIDKGGTATLGLVLDGRRSNAAQITAGYVQQIAAVAGIDARTVPTGSRVTHWFNPALDYIWTTIPSLIAILLSVAGVSITAQSIAREREMGTFDQLMVSPLRTHEILIGKLVPPYLVGLVNCTLFLLLGPTLFGVPFRGSIPLFYLSVSLYLFALLGIGLATSAASTTQQQAFLGAFAVTVPVTLLSGYASPIENMPRWLQIVTYLNPERYFIELSLGQFLKAMPPGDVLQLLWPLVLIAAGTLSLAAWMFRARME